MRLFKALGLIIFAFFALLMMTAGPVSGAPRLEMVPDTVIFGVVPHLSNFYATVILKSVGDDTLRIDSLNTICPCIKMPLQKKVLPPGDSVVIRLSYDSEFFAGQRDRFPHIYTNVAGKPAMLGVLSTGVDSIENQNPIFVRPYRIAASQFGDKLIKKYVFEIVNKSAENVPLKLLYWDNEYFDLDFPAYVPPKSTAKGTLTLNAKGEKSEFENSITFEFITEFSERKSYSIPIVRKIYRSQQKAPE